MIKKAMSMVGKTKPSPTQALEGLKMLVNAKSENHKITQEETTKRKNINAVRDVEIERIQAQKDVLKTYLEGIFSERKYMIEEMFDKLNKGIENDNLELIQMSMSSIVSIAKESPLKQVESLVNDFKNDDVKSITI